MKVVAAARWQTGRYGKHNLRQHTISYTETESELSPTAVPIGECEGNCFVIHKSASSTADETRAIIPIRI
jgi:hypothetical protein